MIKNTLFILDLSYSVAKSSFKYDVYGAPLTVESIPIFLAKIKMVIKLCGTYH